MHSSIPLMILVIEMLHHTPVTPITLSAERISAKGILNPVNTRLITVGGMVLPIPLKAPLDTISTHMNICDIPSIFKYTAPCSIASGSGMNTENICLGNTINKNEDKAPIKNTILNAET